MYPGRFWEPWEVLGGRVKSWGRSWAVSGNWEILRGLGGSWEVLGSLGIAWRCGWSWEVLGGLARSWEVLRGRLRSDGGFEAMAPEKTPLTKTSLVLVNGCFSFEIHHFPLEVVAFWPSMLEVTQAQERRTREARYPRGGQGELNYPRGARGNLLLISK